jgi:hypothetical protein
MRICYRLAGLVLKLAALAPVPAQRGETGWVASAGLPLSRAAMIRMLPRISKLIVMSVAEDTLKIDFAED